MDFKINENYDKIVVVDPGKNAVKVLVFSSNYDLLKRFKFPSKTKKKRNFYDIDGGSEFMFKVDYNDEKYLVGEGIDDNYNFETTKNNLHHKLCIYVAIARAVTNPNEKVHLIIGYPSSDFVNSSQRVEYFNMINSDDEVTISVNDEVNSFEIEDLVVYSEGMALRPRILNPNRRVNVIDIGGQNINNKEYDIQGNTLNSFSLDEAGINHLEEFIKKELRRFIQADKFNVDSIDTEKAIKNGHIEELDDKYLNNYKTTQEFMEDVVLTFIEKSVLGQLSAKGTNLYQRGNLLIFTGGGSILLRPYIEKMLVNNEGNMYFSPTAQWDNAISYVIKDLGDRCRKVGKAKEAQLIGQKILKQTDLDELALFSEF